MKYFFENTTEKRHLEGEPVWRIEEIRKQAFPHENNFERKIFSCRWKAFSKMNGEQRKVAIMLIRFPDGKKGPVITLRALVGRIFV